MVTQHWRRRRRLAALALTLCIGSVSAHAAGPPLTSPVGALIEPLLKAHRGDAAVIIRHLGLREQYAFRSEAPMPTASLIKVAVMVEAYQQADAGQLDLDQTVTIRTKDRVPGSGILTANFSSDVRLSLRDTLGLMITHSDNTATNALLDSIGLKSVSNTMVKHGFPQTKIHSKVYRRNTSIYPSRSKLFGLGSTTAAEMASILEKIQAGHFGNADKMLGHLLACNDRTKLARFLPTGLRFAHKSGAVSRIRTDAGIMYCSTGPVVVCVLTANNEDQRFTEDNEADLLCAVIGEQVASHYHQRPTTEIAPEKPLGVGAHGRLVEDLQRTLNAQRDPMADLSVDGDFGPATEEAVRKFQTTHQLPVTGLADAATWQKLGPVVAEKPVASPAVVNQENQQLARQPVDSLTGPPFVTCKAWAIANATTGKVLWEANARKARDVASTTKMMTALVVLELGKEDPDIWDEQVTFSRRADQTVGSTAGVRAGESLSSQELLYGLLLPSGNDASVALAEHFGERAAKKFKVPQQGDNDSLALFVASMNQLSKRLKLESTQWKNPHGLTEAGHQSSARDLIKIAIQARTHERFRKVTTTRQRGCMVVGQDGHQRNLMWKNTNRLLRIEGYHGVKTGTTSAAGACLVSLGSRGEDKLMVVVLGATSSDARYVDTRNLFRWAWIQRAQ